MRVSHSARRAAASSAGVTPAAAALWHIFPRRSSRTLLLRICHAADVQGILNTINGKPCSIDCDAQGNCKFDIQARHQQQSCAVGPAGGRQGRRSHRGEPLAPALRTHHLSSSLSPPAGPQDFFVTLVAPCQTAACVVPGFTFVEGGRRLPGWAACHSCPMQSTPPSCCRCRLLCLPCPGPACAYHALAAACTRAHAYLAHAPLCRRLHHPRVPELRSSHCGGAAHGSGRAGWLPLPLPDQVGLCSFA